MAHSTSISTLGEIAACSELQCSTSTPWVSVQFWFSKVFTLARALLMWPLFVAGSEHAILSVIFTTGKGCIFSFDPVGSYEREVFRAGGTASSLLQPLLDNQVCILRAHATRIARETIIFHLMTRFAGVCANIFDVDVLHIGPGRLRYVLYLVLEWYIGFGCIFWLIWWIWVRFRLDLRIRKEPIMFHWPKSKRLASSRCGGCYRVVVIFSLWHWIACECQISHSDERW